MRRAITLPLPLAATARVDIPRAAGVTLGLGATGAVAGAPVGSLLLAAMSLAADGYDFYSYMPDVLLAGAVAGGALGALALPFTAWTLPRVTVGQILSATTAATIVGILAGSLLTVLNTAGPM